MTPYRVFVATTNGPSDVQRLAEEDPDVASVVCLNGTSQALPISGGYDAFVRKPTGVIEKTFGHPVFRADVGAPITDGQSWQLGFYTAHLLKSRQALAEKGDLAASVLWISGEVNHDLSIAPIAHLAEKIAASKDLFDEMGAAGTTVTCLLHPDNAAEAESLLPPACRLIAIDQASGLDGILFINDAPEPGHHGVAAIPPASAASLPVNDQGKDDVPQEPEISKFWRMVGFSIAIVLMLSLGLPFWSDLLGDKKLDLSAPEPAKPFFQPSGPAVPTDANPANPDAKPVVQKGSPMDIVGSNPPIGPARLALFERRTPPGTVCGDDHRGIRSEIPLTDRGFRLPAGLDLCRMLVKVDNASEQPIALVLDVAPAFQRIRNGEQTDDQVRELQLAEIVKPGEGVGMALHNLWPLRKPGRLALTVIALPAYSPLVQEWAKSTSADRGDLLRRIDAAGGHFIIETIKLGPPRNRAAERFQ